MGIKNLNNFLLEMCKKTSIGKQSLQSLHNKVVVVDTSIYMYKFLAQNALIENFYLMISLFRQHQITPLFVFDGKPPPEKRELLRQRSQMKKIAEQKYLKLQDELNALENATTTSMTHGTDVKHDIITELESLKKQFIRIRDNDIQQVKSLITAYGLDYYDAQGEADRVCAYLVLSGKAWACLSDDMDMFVYGCPRVLRHLSLINNTVLLYDMLKILTDLNMNENTFREIMVLSGTDYNTKQNTNLCETMKYYKQYTDLSFPKSGFYPWLKETTEYISDYDNLMDIYSMFCFPNGCFAELANIIIETRDKIDKNALIKIMRDDGFIFVT